MTHFWWVSSHHAMLQNEFLGSWRGSNTGGESGRERTPKHAISWVHQPCLTFDHWDSGSLLPFLPLVTAATRNRRCLTTSFIWFKAQRWRLLSERCSFTNISATSREAPPSMLSAIYWNSWESRGITLEFHLGLCFLLTFISKVVPGLRAKTSWKSW